MAGRRFGLLDKSPSKSKTETITGDWTFSGATTFSGDVLISSTSVVPFIVNASVDTGHEIHLTNDSETTGASSRFVLSNGATESIAFWITNANNTQTLITGDVSGGRAIIRTLNDHPIQFAVNQLKTAAITSTGLEVWEPGSTTDKLTIRHDGAQIYFDSVNSTAVHFTGGVALQLWDSTSADYVKMEHDGTDFKVTGYQTTNFSIIDADLRVESATPRLIYYEDDAGADEKFWLTTVSGDVLTQKTRTDIDGAGKTVKSITRVGTDVTNYWWNCKTQFSWVESDSSATKMELDHGNDYLWLRDGYGFKISDSGDTDHVTMSHDGTDFLVTDTSGTGDMKIQSMGLQVQSDYVVQGRAAGRNVARTVWFSCGPGGTIGTNVNISHNAARSFNEPSLTNATNLAAGGSSGSYDLTAGGSLILNVSNAIIGLGACSMSYVKTAAQHRFDWAIVSSNIQLAGYTDPAGGNVPMQTIVGASGRVVQLTLDFYTSS